MQPAVFRKISFVFLSLGLLIPLVPLNAADAPAKPAAAATPVFKEFKKLSTTGAITAFFILSALYLYANLQMKKTQPKRVYPKDDSFEEQMKFIHDEILIGQKCLPERPAGFHVDSENPDHFIYEYSKVDARGLMGITEVYLQKTIVPTLLLAVAFNTFKWNFKENANAIIDYVNNPLSIFTDFPAEKPK